MLNDAMHILMQYRCNNHIASYCNIIAVNIFSIAQLYCGSLMSVCSHTRFVNVGYKGVGEWEGGVWWVPCICYCHLIYLP